MAKLIKFIVFAAVCIITAFGIYNLIKTTRIDKNHPDHPGTPLAQIRQKQACHEARPRRAFLVPSPKNDI